MTATRPCQVILETTRATPTRTGLRVQAELDAASYSPDAALAHLLRADMHGTNQPGQARSSGPDQVAVRADHLGTRQDRTEGTIWQDRLAEAEVIAERLITVGQRVSRRTLRAAGLRARHTSFT